MNRVKFIRVLLEAPSNVWRLEYHYEDDRPPERFGEYADQFAATAELQYSGWYPSDRVNGVWEPPLLRTIALGNLVATDSRNYMGVRELKVWSPDDQKTLGCHGLMTQLHLTNHREMGDCRGFSYAAVSTNEWRAFYDFLDPMEIAPGPDPILPLFTGGLFEITCIGHFLTDDSAYDASVALYNRVKEQIGEDMLKILVRLSIEKEAEQHGGRTEGRTQAEVLPRVP